MAICMTQVMTVPDLIKSGACTGGLKKFFDANKINYTAFDVQQLIEIAESQDIDTAIAMKAVKGNGYGCGYDGYDGCGCDDNGNANGNGSGNGNGNGNGYDGYGYEGNGYGYGYSYGNNGNGNGNGYDGYGYGYGNGCYCGVDGGI